jgi:thioredoxin-like negative regulator of GroEL
MKLLPLFLLFFLFPGCLNNQQEKTDAQHDYEIYDLNESSAVILSLVKKNELPLILAESETDTDKIDTLLKNFSPSEIAFEVEVLNQEKPVVIVYYDPTENNDEIITALTESAKKHKDNVKFVKIDKDKLFKLTEKSEIDTFPTVLIIKDRIEVARFERPTMSLLDDELQRFVHS